MTEKISCIIVNISWNSNQWRGVSNDKTGFGWVKGGNIPGESWNFDFENEDNADGLMHGFCQFQNDPKSSEAYKHLVIFSSKDVASDKENKIVGVYGKANVLKTIQQLKSGRPCNITAPKEMCVFFQNNLNHSDKRFLEGKQKIGQVGFNKLVDKNNVLSVIDEAQKANPNESESLEKIKMWLKDKELVDGKDSLEGKNVNMSSAGKKLNVILYGPPGTGKTYVTRQKAVEICDGTSYPENGDYREVIKKRYEVLKNEGRIVFCTFHQSMSYEDFVEGIKPIVKDDEGNPINPMIYDVKNGLLKDIVEAAKKNYENSQKTEEVLKTESYWHDKLEEFLDEAVDSSAEFNNKKGNKKFYIASNDKSITISSPDSPIRKVISLSKNKILDLLNNDVPLENVIDISKRENNRTPQQEDSYIFTICNKMREKYSKENATDVNKVPLQNYLLIIDEINRGNIAQIFGELITLIEDSKRKGEDDETSVILPYSHEEFCLPPNLYILGTMNTADRSVEALDTALRRRFVFEEMMPKPDVLNPNVEGLNLPSLLRGLNRRVEYLLDRDHTIGHAYFINVQTKKDLDAVFKNKIIPQLQEYFYSDWRKIQLILGEDIVGNDKDPNDFGKIFGVEANDVDVESSKNIFYVKKDWSIDAYKKICAE